MIDPGTQAFESKTPGALFVSLSRAKSAGNSFTDPDFAWHPSVMINEDRLCQAISTPTVRERSREIARIDKMSKSTKTSNKHLFTDSDLHDFLSQIWQKDIS